MELTSRELEEELAEKKADVQALLQSRDILFKRIVDVQDSSKSKLTPLHEWAGAHALMNTFDIVINAAERVVDELEALRDNVKEEPRLRIVRNDE